MSVVLINKRQADVVFPAGTGNVSCALRRADNHQIASLLCIDAYAGTESLNGVIVNRIDVVLRNGRVLFQDPVSAGVFDVESNLI